MRGEVDRKESVFAKGREVEGVCRIVLDGAVVA